MFEVLLHLVPVFAVLALLIASVGYLSLFFKRPIIQSRTKWLTAGFTAQLMFLALECLDFFSATNPDAPGAVLSFGSPLSLSILSAALVPLFLIAQRWRKMEVLGAFIIPLVLIFFVVGSIAFHLDHRAQAVDDPGLLLWIHMGSALLANVLLVFAFGVSLTVIVHEALLKKKRLTMLQERLPALIVLDTLSGRLIAAGFIFMVCGLGTGALFAALRDMQFVLVDPRILWSFVTLAAYGILLFARNFFGWRGRRAAWLTVFGFSTLVLSFVFVNFFSESFHVY